MQEFAKFTQDNSFDLKSLGVYKLSDVDLSKMDSIKILRNKKAIILP